MAQQKENKQDKNEFIPVHNFDDSPSDNQDSAVIKRIIPERAIVHTRAVINDKLYNTETADRVVEFANNSRTLFVT